MGKRHCVIVSCAVSDDDHNQTATQAKEYPSYFFSSDLRRLEQIAESMVGKDRVYKVYGTQATQEHVSALMRHFAGKREDKNLQLLTEEEKNKWSVDPDDEVYVFFFSHGSFLLGDEENGFRIIWPREVDPSPARNIDFRVMTYKGKASPGGKSPLFTENPLKLKEGLKWIKTTVKWSDLTSAKCYNYNRPPGQSKETIRTRTECENFLASAEWSRIEENYDYFMCTCSGETIPVAVPNIPWIFSGVIKTPSQAELEAATNPHYRGSIIRRPERTFSYLVVFKIAHPSINPADKFNDLLVDADYVYATKSEDDGTLSYLQYGWDPTGKTQEYWSYLPPSGTRRFSECSSGVAMTPIITKEQQDGSEKESESRRFYTSTELVKDVANGNTKMFFFIDACLSGLFCERIAALSELEQRELGCFTASDARSLNWSGASSKTRNECKSTPGFFCDAIYKAMFKPGPKPLIEGETQKDVRKKTTYKEVIIFIQNECEGQFPCFYLPGGNTFAPDAYIPDLL